MPVSLRWKRISVKSLSAVPVALAFSFAPVSVVWADNFQIRQTLSTETNTASSVKRANQPLQVKFHLESEGVAMVLLSNNKEEPAIVRLTGDFDGTAASLNCDYTETFTFADDSTVKLVLKGVTQGNKFSANITSTDGTGRFKGFQGTGSLSGIVFVGGGSNLDYSVIQGNYQLKP